MYRPVCRLFRLPSRLQRRARRSRLFTMIVLVLALVTLVTPFYVVYKPPNLLIRYFAHRWPDVLWHVPNAQKTIALTIDDAPSEHTDAILQLLKENDAHATFFVIGGQVNGRTDTLRDMVAGGMELGNHAMHDEPSRSLAPDELAAQMGQVEGYIDRAYASLDMPPPPRYFRPGSGFFSAPMRQQLSEMGYRLVLGSVYPHDPQIPHPKANARHILSMVRPGSIIICHDRRGWTVPMLKRMLPELKRRGYKVTTVTGLLEAGGAGDKGKAS
jgi:peptidoglycan/xylan/chitin deacetylase (PgdA/CDA1 family)